VLRPALGPGQVLHRCGSITPLLRLPPPSAARLTCCAGAAPCDAGALPPIPPMPPWVQESLSSVYAVMFGDTPRSVFIIDYVPLLYITVLPLLNLFLKLMCQCEPGALTARPWPPKNDAGGSKRGQRVVRRIASAIAAQSRMAQMAALSSQRSGKGPKNKVRAQQALTSQLQGTYGAV